MQEVNTSSKMHEANSIFEIQKIRDFLAFSFRGELKMKKINKFLVSLAYEVSSR